MAERNEDPDQGEAEALKLRPWQRAVLLVLGGSLVGAGGVAYAFRSSEGAATVALMTIGALLLLLGVWGQLPEQIATGSTTISLHRALKKTVDDNADTLTQEQLKSTVEERYAGPAGSAADKAVTARYAEHYAFEKNAIDMLKQAAKELHFTPTLQGRGEDLRVDAAVIVPDGKTILVEVKLTLTRQTLVRSLARLGNQDCNLLIISQDWPESVQSYLRSENVLALRPREVRISHLNLTEIHANLVDLATRNRP